MLIPIDELTEEQARAWVEGPLSQHLGDRCYILAERDDAGFWQARIARIGWDGWIAAPGDGVVDAMRNAVRQATVPFGQASAALCIYLPAPAPARIEGKCACRVDPLRWNKRRKCWLPPLETYDLLPGTHCHKCGAYLCRGVAIPHPMSRETLEAAAKAAEEAARG